MTASTSSPKTHESASNCEPQGSPSYPNPSAPSSPRLCEAGAGVLPGQPAPVIIPITTPWGKLPARAER